MDNETIGWVVVLGFMFGFVPLMVLVLPRILLFNKWMEKVEKEEEEEKRKKEVTRKYLEEKEAEKQRLLAQKKAEEEWKKAGEKLRIDNTKKRKYLIQSSRGLVDIKIPECIANAKGCLSTAQGEYSRHNPSRFWEAIQNTAIWLGSLNGYIVQLSNNAFEFRQLGGLCEDTLTFPFGQSAIPDTEGIPVRLDHMVRQGQEDHDYNFAVIYEHIKTRAVLIAGFSTLNTALCNIESTISSSFMDARNVLAEIQHEQQQVLAEIQHEQRQAAFTLEQTHTAINEVARNQETIS